MKFSVVTPTRNALAKLKCCIGSVRGQSGVDVEHIVQDALSSDGTGEWLAKQPDVAAVTEADGGMYDGIQRGWDKASGDVVSWLNSDEQYLPSTLELVEKAFLANPTADFIYGNAIIVGLDGNPIAARREIPLRHRYVRNGTLYSYSCATFFRKRLLDSGLLRFDTKLRYAADADLMLRLLKNNVSSAQIQEYLSLFMLDGTNLSCSPAMLNEISFVQARHGAMKNRLGRRAILLGRYLEKAISGSFSNVPLSYKFVTSETPTYKEISALRVGGRFRIDLFSPKGIDN